MTRHAQPPPRGIAWLALFLCAVAAAVGLAFDFGFNDVGRWITAKPGGAAMIGAAAAVFAVLARRVAALLRVRPDAGEQKAARR